MEVKEAIMAILPELEELGEVDFEQYSPPYPNLLKAFLESGKKGLPEFERFTESTVGKDAVGRVLLSLLQYLLIRYRRFEDYSVVKPTIKVFLTLKGWLIENGLGKDWNRVLGSFIGYLVSMLPLIAEHEDKDIALAYTKLMENLTREASEKFDEDYYYELLERVNELKKKIMEKTNAQE